MYLNLFCQQITASLASSSLTQTINLFFWGFNEAWLTVLKPFLLCKDREDHLDKNM